MSLYSEILDFVNKIYEDGKKLDGEWYALYSPTCSKMLIPYFYKEMDGAKRKYERYKSLLEHLTGRNMGV